MTLSPLVGTLLFGTVILGARHWLGWAAALAVIALVVLVWAYRQARYAAWVRLLAGVLKAAGIALLAILLVEPLFTGTRPRPGSNLFLVVADNSKSLELADRGSRESRGALMKQRLAEQSPWLTRLAQDFDVRRYEFDTTLRPVKDFGELTQDGQASAIRTSLTALAQRFRGQPIAGILLLTDGNATDWDAGELDSKSLPPVYPVVLGTDSGLVDLSVTRVSVSQTNFEASPVTIVAEIAGQDVAGKKAIVRVLDEAGKEMERRTVTMPADEKPLAQRFLLKPERPGISFYTVQAALEGEEDAKAGRTAEATLANNRRLATVDRGGGPYRVLYVSGRPNWEFKFLRRALDEDDEVNLVGLVRIAKREPKFTFLSRSGETSNPLFRGFFPGKAGGEEAEQYDQPVLIRLGTEDKDELQGGFPLDAEDLFRYHAVILDDIEAEFFKQDQLSLLQQFVSQRGGGLLMLGGKESFGDGGYLRTPVGEMLPVYLEKTTSPPAASGYRLKLSREGWLQPWARLRTNEQDETKRLESMPAFKAVNRAGAIKPGASVVAEVEGDGGSRPALVVQPFGRGRACALLITDLWRWNIRREDHKESDLDKAWRQMVRWLVADVPQTVEVETRPAGDAAGSVEVLVRARDKQFQPLDNAGVTLWVKTPDEREIELVAEVSDRGPGTYLASFVPRAAGAYRASVSVVGPDGSMVGERETGWSVEPETEEFRTLTANLPLLERLAADTGGETLALEGLETFVSSLPNRKIPIVENWTYPLWHQWHVFLLAIACLVGEWGLRRWRGLP